MVLNKINLRRITYKDGGLGQSALGKVYIEGELKTIISEEGQFKDDILYEGKKIDNEGISYEGQFVNNKLNGLD